MRFATNIRGYSIFELLIVLVMLALLSTSFSRFYSKNKSKVACNKLDQFLSNAQAKAYLTNKTVNLEIKNNEIKELDYNYKYSLARGLSFEQVKFGNLLYGANVISFDAKAWSSAGKLTIQDQNNNFCTIYQSILGARRIE